MNDIANIARIITKYPETSVTNLDFFPILKAIIKNMIKGMVNIARSNA